MGIIVSHYYKYTILLDPKVKRGNFFSYSYKEDTKWREKVTRDNYVHVVIEKQLTEQQLLEMFERTDGIIGIRGDFRNG